MLIAGRCRAVEEGETMAKTAQKPMRARKPGPEKYSDGHPLDSVHYLECKVILKPDRFTSVDSFREFGRLVRRTAEEMDLGFITDPKIGRRPDIREIVFYDTPDFRLYNNAFILRRRIAYEDGFPVGDPEIVFKFRHPDVAKAAAVDARPKISGNYEIKFKAEALPLRDRVGGMRTLYSHNCQFGWSQMDEASRTAMRGLAHVFPALAVLKKSDREVVCLVNGAIVEEVLLELGQLDFGKGVLAKANVALWRTRGEHTPLVGEFAYQCKFERDKALHKKAQQRSDEFFVELQHKASEWVSLGTTKTGMVYRMNGNAPQSHE
jgi:hypothetical protein